MKLRNDVIFFVCKLRHEQHVTQRHDVIFALLFSQVHQSRQRGQTISWRSSRNYSVENRRRTPLATSPSKWDSTQKVGESVHTGFDFLLCFW